MSRTQKTRSFFPRSCTLPSPDKVLRGSQHINGRPRLSTENVSEGRGDPEASERVGVGV